MVHQRQRQHQWPHRSGYQASAFNASPTSTTQYWVRITDSANGSAGAAHVDSNAATITVDAALSIGTAGHLPSSTTPIWTCWVRTAANGTTPYTYQWYIGASGNISSPIGGATSSTFGASPTTTTQYWVRINVSANGTAASAHATAMPPPQSAKRRKPDIGTQPANDNGQSDLLSVIAANGTPLQLPVVYRRQRQHQ